MADGVDVMSEVGATVARLNGLIDRLQTLLSERERALARAEAERDAEAARRAEAVAALDRAIEDLRAMAEE